MLFTEGSDHGHQRRQTEKDNKEMFVLSLKMLI